MRQRCVSIDMDTIHSVLAHAGGLSTAHVVEGLGPGPDASKQLVARDLLMLASQWLHWAATGKPLGRPWDALGSHCGFPVASQCAPVPSE